MENEAAVEAEPQKFDLVIDTVTGKPACVILQVVYGCKNRSIVSRFFDGGTWELSPVKTFAIVAGTMDEWRTHAEKINQIYGRKK